MANSRVQIFHARIFFSQEKEGRPIHEFFLGYSVCMIFLFSFTFIFFGGGEGEIAP